MSFVISIDQGTTGTTALVVDFTKPNEPLVIGRHTVEFSQHYPQNSWVEHDLDEIWASLIAALERAIEIAMHSGRGFNKNKIAGIGITNQRETLCIFERKTGRPLSRAIVWQCKRSSEIVRHLKQAGHDGFVRKKTGLILDPYFTGTKLRWVLDNVPEVAQKILKGEAGIGTIDTYLISRMTSGTSYVTEPSNASRTLYFNTETGHWDAELLELFGKVKKDLLPEIKQSADFFGSTKGLSFIPDGIPITGVLGDQQAALAGQTCYIKGQAKCTYGTGAFLLVNLGQERLFSKSGMLTTIAWSLKGKLTHAFEGSCFVAGAAIQFLRDQWQVIQSSPDSEAIAQTAQAAPHLYFVPALAGLGSPHWDSDARGAILGLTRGTTKAQLVRAALEGVAFQVADLTDAISHDLGGKISVLRVDGGAAANNLLMQTQANLSDITVDRPENIETTGFGAALFSALGSGIFNNLEDLKSARSTQRIFMPSIAASERERFRNGWMRAIKAVRTFANSAPEGL
jgi:glycerol kinase